MFELDQLKAWGGYAAADPFGIHVQGVWYVFFEMLVRAGNAVIAVASSKDLSDWQLLGVCLRERHHLSFPFVFEHGGRIYLMPESKSVRRVDLYRATEFPMRWERCDTLVRGRLMDATIAAWQGRYWMFAGWHSYWLKLFYASQPTGPWRRHWMPVARTYSKENVRPGGRPISMEGELVRFVQDNRACYGKQLRAMKVTCLNRLWFSERPFGKSPILTPEGTGWYGHRMHHLDLHPYQGGWVGFVDGCN
jgi:hypothetical protein